LRDDDVPGGSGTHLADRGARILGDDVCKVSRVVGGREWQDPMGGGRIEVE